MSEVIDRLHTVKRYEVWCRPCSIYSAASWLAKVASDHIIWAMDLSCGGEHILRTSHKIEEDRSAMI